MGLESTADRVARALRGEVVDPPVAGLSFVPADVLPGAPALERVARTLARTCADARLDFVFAPAVEPWAEALVEEAHAVGVRAWWAVDGVLWPALEALGTEAGLRATVRDPGSVRAAMRDALDAARPLVRRGLALGADAIVVADDLGGALGPLVAPAFADGEVAPLLAEAIAPAREAGVPAILHSDGDVRVLMPAIARAGFAAVHGDCGGAALVADAATAARAAGLALVGGVSAAGLASLPRAAAAGSLAGVLARAGGLLLADDGGIETPAQFAAAVAALAAART